MFRMFYAFFWVIPWHLNFICGLFRTLCLCRLHRRVGTYPSMKMELSVPKCRHIKFRHRGITQKKAIQRHVIWLMKHHEALSVWHGWDSINGKKSAYFVLVNVAGAVFLFHYCSSHVLCLLIITFLPVK